MRPRYYKLLEYKMLSIEWAKIIKQNIHCCDKVGVQLALSCGVLRNLRTYWSTYIFKVQGRKISPWYDLSPLLSTDTTVFASSLQLCNSSCEAVFYLCAMRYGFFPPRTIKKAVKACSLWVCVYSICWLFCVRRWCCQKMRFVFNFNWH